MPDFLTEVWVSELRSSGMRGSTLTSGPPPSPLMLPSAPPISLIVIGEPGLLDPWSWALHLKIYSNNVASQISVFYVGKGINSEGWGWGGRVGGFYKLTHLWGWCLDLVYLGTLHLPLFPRLRCSDQSPSAMTVLLVKSTGYCLLCMCVCVGGYVCRCLCMCACMWRTEVDVKCFSYYSINPHLILWTDRVSHWTRSSWV